MEPYLVTAFVKPTKKQEEDGEVALLVLPLQCVMADSEEGAIIEAAALVPAEHRAKRGRLEVRCIPFCSAT